jgi:transcriptional regulator with XRE-family HTH domain
VRVAWFRASSKRPSSRLHPSLVGISVDFLSLIERGIDAPSFEVLDQIAKAVKVPVSFLFDFGGKSASTVR